MSPLGFIPKPDIEMPILLTSPILTIAIAFKYNITKKKILDNK
jgi:hypothetical protein